MRFVTSLVLVLLLACAGSAAAEGEGGPGRGWDPEIRDRTHELARNYFAALHAHERNPDLTGLREVVRDLDAELARSSSIPAPLTFGPTTDQATPPAGGTAVKASKRDARKEGAIRTLLSRVRQERQALEQRRQEEPERAGDLGAPILLAKKLEAGLEDALRRHGGARAGALRRLHRRVEPKPAADNRALGDPPSEGGDGARRVPGPRFQTHTQHRKP